MSSEETPTSPCPRRKGQLSVKRAGEWSRWAFRFEIVCVACDVAFTGADDKADAYFKARNLEKFYP